MSARFRFRLFAVLVLIAVMAPAPKGGGVRCSAPRGGSAASVRPPRTPPRSVRPPASTVPVVRRATPVRGPHGHASVSTPPRVAALHAHLAAEEWGVAARAARVLAAEAALADAHPTLTSLSRRCEAVEGLVRLRGELAKPALSAQVVEGFDAALKPIEDSDRTGLIRTYLGCRARLEGHDAAARGLGVTGNGREVLRDMKKIDAADVGNRPADAPLGLPVPEAAPLRFRPDVREALDADLPLMDELARTEKAARAKATALIENEASYQAARARLLMARWPSKGAQAEKAPAPAPKGAEPEVEEVMKLLGREVSAAERVLIRHLRESKSAKETAEMLQEGGR